MGNTYFFDSIKCPWCGREQIEPDGYLGFPYIDDGEEAVSECKDCKKKFKMKMRFQIKKVAKK